MSSNLFVTHTYTPSVALTRRNKAAWKSMVNMSAIKCHRLRHRRRRCCRAFALEEVVRVVSGGKLFAHIPLEAAATSPWCSAGVLGVAGGTAVLISSLVFGNGTLSLRIHAHLYWIGARCITYSSRQIYGGTEGVNGWCATISSRPIRRYAWDAVQARALMLVVVRILCAAELWSRMLWRFYGHAGFSHAHPAGNEMCAQKCDINGYVAQHWKHMRWVLRARFWFIVNRTTRTRQAAATISNLFTHTDYANYLNHMRVICRYTIIAIGQNNTALLLSALHLNGTTRIALSSYFWRGFAKARCTMLE